MRATVIHAPHDIPVEEVPDPAMPAAHRRGGAGPQGLHLRQ
ncbi:hypothetical protein SMICM17S_12090 [Streptomyces microflavus]